MQFHNAVSSFYGGLRVQVSTLEPLIGPIVNASRGHFLFYVNIAKKFIKYMTLVISEYTDSSYDIYLTLAYVAV